MGNPEVDIVIPCYNMSRYLPQAIESALDQTYRPVRVVVVDDGSAEDIRSPVESYGRSVEYIRQENRGQAAARNTGIKHTKGEYICFLDADDILFPSKTANQVRFLAEHPRVDLVYGRFQLVNEDRVQFPYADQRPFIEWEDYLDPLSVLCSFNPFSALVRRRTIDQVGLFREDLRGNEDWAYWLQCVISGAKFAYSPDETGLYRQHRASASGSFLRIAGRESQLMRLYVDMLEKKGMLSGRRAQVASCGIRFIASRHLTLKQKDEYDRLFDLARKVSSGVGALRSETYYTRIGDGVTARISNLLVSKDLCDLGLQPLAFYCLLQVDDIRKLRHEAIGKGLGGVFDEVARVMEKSVSEALADNAIRFIDAPEIPRVSADSSAGIFKSLEQRASNEISHTSYSIHRLGLLDLDDGKTDEAIIKFKRAIRLNPYYWIFYVDLIQALHMGGYKNETKRVIQRLRGCHSESNPCFYFIGKEFLYRRKVFSGLCHLFRSALAFPATTLRCLFGDIKYYLGRFLLKRR